MTPAYRLGFAAAQRAALAHLRHDSACEGRRCECLERAAERIRALVPRRPPDARLTRPDGVHDARVMG